MNCEWVKDNISAYIDNELTTFQRQKVENHLTTCAVCKAEYNRFAMAWDALNVWEDTTPPSHLKEAILENVKSKKSFNLFRVLMPVAAVFLIAFSILLFYDRVNFNESGSLLSEKRGNETSIQEKRADISEDEIISDLHIIEEQEFYDSIDVLKNIDYLPVVENDDDNKSSTGYFAA